MADILQGLNQAQREAVTTTEGYIRVIAGAGSGKTRALSHRFAFLVNELGILPGNILCVTFTNKSANEMRQRIHHLTGDNDTGYINTFHGFCVLVLQEDSHAIQYPKSFLVLDNSDIDAMLQMIYEERGLSMQHMTYGKAREMIEIRKLHQEPEYYLDMIEMSLDTLREKYEKAVEINDIIFYGYLYQEKKCFGLDYNDLIQFALYIFEQNPDIRLKWQKRLAYIMIDEFQDIDQLQYKLMEVLSGYHKNLFIVGDPDQTIYTWRGADVRYLLDFDRVFPGTKTIMMMENYRSSPQILAVANSLIDKNRHRIKKDLLPTLPDGDPVLCCMADTTKAEIQQITAQIMELKEQGVPLQDMTVLYRARHLTRTIEEIFMQAKIPYSIYSGTQFFQRMEIKNALSYLRMIAYKDDLSFLRVANTPKRKLGKFRMEFLQKYAVQHQCSLYDALRYNLEDDTLKGTKAKQFTALIESFANTYAQRPVSEVLADVLNKSGYEADLRKSGDQERLDNLAELKQAVYEFETTCGEEVTLEHYLSHIALFTNNDLPDKEDRVRLMTVHAAKGLEFPYVFLCQMNEGVFPSRHTNTLESMEEERRLAFVAVTRARKGLYLSASSGRSSQGTPIYPSRFLLDITPELLTFPSPPRAEWIEAAREYIDNSVFWMASSSTPALMPGQRIRHTVFGPGTITEIDGERSAYIVSFDQIETPRSISFRANLTPEDENS